MFSDEAHSRSSDTDGDDYFPSMTDMMVGLLFIFIIILMAFALNYKTAERSTQSVEADQRAQIQSVRAAVSQIKAEVASMERIEDQRASLLKELKQRLLEAGLDVQIDTASGVLRLPESILFPLNKPDLTPAGQRALFLVARALSSVLPCYSGHEAPPISCRSTSEAKLEAVMVEGHADKSGSDSWNWQLSTERAIATFRELDRWAPMLRMLKNEDGQPLLSVSGYGSDRPIAAPIGPGGQNPINRRIDLRFIMQTSHERALRRIEERLESILAK